MAVQTTSTRSTRTDSREGGRKRYVGFLIRGRLFKRGELIHYLNRLTRRGEPSPWLSYFEGEKGIVRCTNNNRDTIVSILQRANDEKGDILITPLITSGSIKKVKSVLSRYE
ncbi:MAG TPA: hypothetical protein ENN76_03255 [Euryarchaeota archaeon]|nr:hypothetical protein [Euryarchaeota archaeon]